MPEQKVNKPADERPRERARRMIQEMIASKGYRRGDRLPPYRELCKRFGVSIITLQRSMDDLAEKGIVYRLVGSGTYVARRLSPGAGKMKKVSLITAFTRTMLMEMPYLNQITTGIFAYSDSLHCDVEFTAFHAQAGRLDVTELCQQVDGVVLLGIPNEGFVLHFAEEKIPLAVVDYLHPNVPADFVVVDNELAVRSAMQPLLDAGHRRIAYMHGWMSDPLKHPGEDNHVLSSDDIERGDAYKAVMRAAGQASAVRVINGGVNERGNLTEGDMYRNIRKLMKSPDPPTAFCTSGISLAMTLVSVMDELGIRVPEDVSIVSAAGAEGEGRVGQRTIPYSCVSFREMGIQAVQALEHRRNNARLERARVIRIDSTFVPGSTLASPRKTKAPEGMR